MVLSVTCATFVLSDKVTAETLVHLNSDYKGDIPPLYTNFFNPVMHDMSQMLRSSEKPVDFVVDVFEQSSSPEELHELYSNTVSKQMKANDLVGALACAVLDERSTEDNTVIICYEELTIDDVTSGDDDFGTAFHAWRVKFTDAYEMVRTIEDCNIGVVEEYVIKASKRFTNDNGIFEFAKAMKAIDAGDRG